MTMHQRAISLVNRNSDDTSTKSVEIGPTNMYLAKLPTKLNISLIMVRFMLTSSAHLTKGPTVNIHWVQQSFDKLPTKSSTVKRRLLKMLMATGSYSSHSANSNTKSFLHAMKVKMLMNSVRGFA